MSNSERAKGIRIEREIVELHRKIGVPAERVPLSGAAQYQGTGHDVDIYAFGKDPLRAEVKGRADGAGFTMLERWLSDYDLLFLRRDRQEPLVVLPWRTWVRIVGNENLSTATPPNIKNGHADTTCGEHEDLPATQNPPRGEAR